MRFGEFRYLADENIPPVVDEWLQLRGVDVVSVLNLGLGGSTDAELLALATQQSRVILTCDSDFGTLAIRDGHAIFGILHVRPAHVSLGEWSETLTAVFESDEEPQPPFIATAVRSQDTVRLRVREVRNG